MIVTSFATLGPGLPVACDLSPSFKHNKWCFQENTIKLNTKINGEHLMYELMHFLISPPRRSVNSLNLKFSKIIITYVHNNNLRMLIDKECPAFRKPTSFKGMDIVHARAKSSIKWVMLQRI